MAAYRFQETCHPVYGKHPDRGISREFGILVLEGVEPGEEDLHTPSGGSAGQKIMLHMDKYVKER